jgi:hypothetical protein
LRLCEKIVFSNGTKTGSTSYNNVNLFSPHPNPLPKGEGASPLSL